MPAARSRPVAILLFVFVSVLVCGIARAQSPRVLYTWEGTGNIRMWDLAFGDNLLVFTNDTPGELTVTETGPEGSASALRDGFNEISENGPTIGGLDLTGLAALEFELGHSGSGPVNVQFFVQATPGFAYRPLGPDQAVEPAPAVYAAPLEGLTPEEFAYIRVIGISIREHLDQGNLVWTLREVRSAGEPLLTRDLATHEEGASDGGLQGAIVNFDVSAVSGNDGGQNQSGLNQNLLEPPAGNTGSLHWLDLAGQNGAAVTWHNGTVFNGNTFNERPADLSNYQKVVVRMAAANGGEGAVTALGVQYFLQTGNFNFFQAGPVQSLPADGEFHDLEFPLTSVPRLDFVAAHGINLQSHPAGDLLIDVDHVQAQSSDFRDCNRNRIPDERDLAEGRSRDCDFNQVPDECDIEKGDSADCNQNGIPDQCDIAGPPTLRVLYTWQGQGDPRSWMKSFGVNEATLENNVEGELTALETGPEPGAGWALSDGFNAVAEDAPSVGGLDLTGMTSLEFELGHSGAGQVQAQFYVQATPDFEYVSLGPDQAIAPGVASYSAPLGLLNPGQITYLRAVGISIRDHFAEGNLNWTLREVRAAGVPLTQRDFATHEPGSTDGGLQGAAAFIDVLAIQDNDGQSNQTGLSHNVGASPPGNTGSLRWIDVAARGGGGVAWFNGTAWKGNSFNERPTDMSGYQKIAVRMAATNVQGDDVTSVEVQYFLQVAGFNSHPAGPAQSLAADGRFHDLVFPIAEVPDRRFVDAHGIDLGEHDLGDLIIDVDRIQAFADQPTAGDCNGNRIPDSCDIASGLLADRDRNGIPDLCQSTAFRRGDSNADGRVDLSDAIHTFGFLFLGAEPTVCPDGADSNDDGADDLSDGIYTLNLLFLGGSPIPDPGPEGCGPDPTPDPLGECAYPGPLCP